MAFFRKKPVVIEAVQFDGSNSWALGQWAGPFMIQRYPHNEQAILVHTEEGKMRANVGDWIIKGVKGEFYPCKPDIFAATYELVDSPAPVPPGEKE